LIQDLIMLRPGIRKEIRPPPDDDSTDTSE
jgi:hypothetical protein